MSLLREAEEMLENVQLHYIGILSDPENTDISIARGHLRELADREENGTLDDHETDAQRADEV